MLKNVGQDNLIGPIHAEAFDKDQDVLDAFITSNGDNNIVNDKYISSIISGNKMILSGIRGSGKTMVLRTADIVLKKDVKHKLLDYYDYELSEEDKKLMPVYLSFSGFKNDVSLQNEFEMTDEEISYSREIFRGYFYMTILQYILRRIEELDLDKNVEFNFFGLRTKFGINKQVDTAIESFRRIGFRELVKSRESGFDISLKFKELGLAIGPKVNNKRDTMEITMDDMQKTDLFKDTINSICEVYKLDKVVLLFDEVYYLKYLQKEFFNILFGFRNYNKLSYTISAYPTFMEYGDYFDIPDDAMEVSTTSAIYKPSKEKYEKALIELVKNRIRKYGNCDYNEVIQENALKLLILLTNGNPRLLLQSIDNIWKKNGASKIHVSNITQDLIFDIVDTYYIKFYKDQAKRYKTNIDKISKFLDLIQNRLKDYNNRSKYATIFFLINDDIYTHFVDTINLLHYSRIIDKVRISSFGGSGGSKGRMYILNPMYGWYSGIFNREQISQLPEHVKHSNEKDKKIQFNSLDSVLSAINIEDNISCPVYKLDQCPEVKCKDTYNEHWNICPFHRNISLEVVFPLPNDISIDELNLTPGIHKRLIEGDVLTLKHIIDKGVNGLMTLKQIGNIRSRTIYYLAKEYIDDNL